MASDTRSGSAVLLLHGFWHGAWCWNEVTARLAAHGRRPLAVDMAGHGLRARRLRAETVDRVRLATEPSPIASVDLDAAADLLAAQISALATDGPVVAVAHSFGGVVLTRAAQNVPHLVGRLVYVSAIMPASGVPAVEYLQQPEQQGEQVAPLFVADPAVVGALRLDPGGDDDYRRRLRRAFYDDVDEGTAEAATGLLTYDAPLAVAAGATRLTRDAWGAIPRTYVHCTQDLANRPLLQRRFVQEADDAFPDNPTRVVELRSGHSPFLSAPGPLSDAILDPPPARPAAD